MIKPQRIGSIALLVCALGLLNGLPGQPGFRPGYQPITISPSQNEARESGTLQCAAVVGSVSTPAAYQLPSPLTAARLLKAAGGLTADASENVLIVRQGRILGPILFDPADKELSNVGTILDGDVLIFKPRRGVRTAHFQTAEAEDGSSLAAQPMVENALTPRPVHVACIGLADYPVVLPLPAHKATERTLLLELLGLSPEAAEQGVRRVSGANYSTGDGSLLDGTVLFFNARVIDLSTVRPVEPFPLPRKPAPENTSEPPRPLPIDVAPSTTFTAPAGNGPAPVEVLAELPVESAPQRAAPGQRLNEPLPGFPFVVRETYPSTVAADGLQSVSNPEVAEPILVDRFQPAEVVRGGGAIDVTDTPAGLPSRPASGLPAWPPESFPRSAEAQPIHTTSVGEWHTPGVREPAVIRAPQLAPRAAALEGTTTVQASVGTASLLETPVDQSAIAGVLLAAMGSLAVSYFFVRSDRQPGPVDVETAPVAEPVAVQPARVEEALPLQSLLENQLPLVEEPARVVLPERLYGPVVGRKRLMIDAAHSQPVGPHFALNAKSEQRQSQRFERHLVAADRVSRPVAEGGSPVASAATEPAGSAPATAATSPAATQTLRYDIVQPEPAHGTHRPRTARSQASGQGELLARVLGSLQGET